MGYGDSLNVKNCGSNNVVRVLSVTTNGGKTLSKDTVLTVAAEFDGGVKPDDEIKLKISLKKKFAWFFVSIPGAIIDKIGDKIKDPNLKYLGKARFSLDVHCLRKYYLNAH